MGKRKEKVRLNVNTSKVFAQTSNELIPEKIVTGLDGKDFIPFGEKNTFPQELAKIGREAPTHRALLNSKAEFIKGAGFETLNAKLEQTILNINSKGETLTDLFYKVIFDELMFGNSYIEIVTDSAKRFVMMYHIDSTMVRLSKEADSIIIHPDWINYSTKKQYRKELPLYPNFVKEGRLQRTAIHIKRYEPTFMFYGVPDWFAALNSAIIERGTNEYNKSELKNTFSISGMLVVPGINDPEDAKTLDKKLEDYTGSAEANKLFPLYLPDTASGENRDKAELIDFRRSLSGSWTELHRQSQDDLLKAHSWYPNLAGFPSANGFDTNVILNEYNVALSTTIKPKQAQYLDVFNKIFDLFGLKDEDLSFKNQSPIRPVDKNDLKFIWELREEAGLDFNPNDPLQQRLYKEIK